MPENPAPLPDFTRWPSFPFEGDMRVKKLAPPVDVEPPRSGEDGLDCVACATPDDAYIWVSERWRVRAMDRPTGLPMVLILECRSHLDMGDLPNLLAAELGVMTVRLERAIRSLDGVARVHVNRWGDGSAHLHMWFLARPYGRLQLRGTFLSLWDDILPVIPEPQWRENLALVAAWLADFGGQANAEPAHIQWESPSTFVVPPAGPEEDRDEARRPTTLGDVQAASPPADSWVRHSDAPTAGSLPGTPAPGDTAHEFSSPSEGAPASSLVADAAAPGSGFFGGSPDPGNSSVAPTNTVTPTSSTDPMGGTDPAATGTTSDENDPIVQTAEGRPGYVGTGVLSTGAGSAAAGSGSTDL
ncbi:hypothetical protein ADL15_38150 [Actinoplanes awajinensis subsp. mycoplanecinus]|uniref:HIT domain-containing protein n=2 Tax=Actinoplanes awajinensis TaxID=135946 RepID=A0A101JGQ8_9ACTN|nr:hypothetical protein ADL15_38150 [Actinoplanes awajinensis subsp. mycoplanecinus]